MTIKSAICLQIKANLHQSYGHLVSYKPIFIRNTLHIVLIRALEQISIVISD